MDYLHASSNMGDLLPSDQWLLLIHILTSEGVQHALNTSISYKAKEISFILRTLLFSTKNRELYKLLTYFI